MGHLMRLELIHESLLVSFVNHYTTRDSQEILQLSRLLNNMGISVVIVKLMFSVKEYFILT